jgi:hypothetical protein
MILTDDEAIAKKINSAIFPGLQGGPLMHVIAAKAVAFGEALTPEFKAYAKAVLANSKALAARLEARGLAVVSGGTDTHLSLIDLRPYGISGKDADEALERSFITCNKNGIPGDPLPPTKTSGIRVGSPAGTTRGFGVAEFEAIGDMIADVLGGLKDKGEAGDPPSRPMCASAFRPCAPVSRSTRARVNIGRFAFQRRAKETDECAARSAGPTTRRSRTAGRPKTQAAIRRRRISARSLRRPLHHLRARAVARYLTIVKKQWRAPAVRAGQARPLARYRLPQAADRSRKDRKARIRHPAPDRDQRRERNSRAGDRRTGDGRPQGAGQRRLYPFRQRL